MAPNYQNGKVYCVRCRAENDDIVYVGSTVRRLCERMAEHRKRVVKHPDWKLYKLMAEVGVENFHIELLVDFPCERRDQLLAEEGRHIRLLHPKCNRAIAGRTQKEWYNDNKETISASKKEKYDKEATFERYKKWYAENSERVLAQKKEYLVANRDAILAKKKEWYEANKDAINARRREKAAAAAAATS